MPQTPDAMTEALIEYAPQQSDMRSEVLAGLRDAPKRFPTKYLYDAAGSRLFEEITRQPEYYPTRTEIGILRDRAEEIARVVGQDCCVVEPGAGSGVKTRLLLELLENPQAYVPIEISRSFLLMSARALNDEFPDVDVVPVWADFTAPVRLPELEGIASRRVVFFPGSTIGNFEPDMQREVLRRCRAFAGDDGGVLIGVDLQKPRCVLEAAYDDAAGANARFALNILTRLNRELGADFDPTRFRYDAPYDEAAGRIEMGLVSETAQTVRMGPDRIALGAGEKIRTEFSQKYTRESFTRLAASAGLRPVECWMDGGGLFSVWYLAVK